ncbi:MAG: hypothetical protein ABIQ64_04805 [Candidatus Saccharimonadales bacterium]
MEPTLPSPHGSPETGPSIPRVPEAPRRTIEHVPEPQHGAERPAPGEQRSGAGAGDTPPPMPVIQLPTQAPVHQDDTQQVPITTSPAVAADEDLIEKEWVEKAKKIISDTKHDPYSQEQAVRQLQADYLSKRYGKVIKVPKEE